MRLYGLIGYPLTHSFSKRYFDEKFEKEGLSDCRFENFPLSNIEEIRELVQSSPKLKGLAITIPYKQSVIRFLTDSSRLPEGLAACNCIKVEGDALTGFNTDHTGFEKSIVPRLEPYHRKALVLGHGGAAAAVIYSLKKNGIGYSIVSRSKRNGSHLTYDELNEETMVAHQLIINTTPLGMHPNMNECPAIPYRFLSSRHLVFDLIYNPAKTMFLQKAEQQGARILNGEEMLVYQAEENWRIWNND